MEINGTCHGCGADLSRCTCEPKIEELHADKDGVRIRASIPRLDHLFQECVSFLAEHGGENFITLTATNPDGQQFEITVRKSLGKTPAERIEELEEQIKRQNNDYLESVHDLTIKHEAEIRALTTGPIDSTTPNRAER